MKFYSRKLIKPGDLNARNTLFGGALLKWIDEEAGIYAMTKLMLLKLVWALKVLVQLLLVLCARLEMCLPNKAS